MVLRRHPGPRAGIQLLERRGERQRASLLAVVLIAAPAVAQNRWGEVKAPSAGEAEAIGGYAAGCVAGAVALPLTGEGFQVMRSSRNRYYGHPRLIAFVERLAGKAERQGLGRLLVGDLSQPRGGPASFGHASHQSGLDVDIWFRLLSKQAAPLRPEQTEQMAMESVIRAADGTLDRQRWDRRYADLLRLAANAPEVDRIFVNPVIKRALCQAGERATSSLTRRPPTPGSTAGWRNWASGAAAITSIVRIAGAAWPAGRCASPRSGSSPIARNGASGRAIRTCEHR